MMQIYITFVIALMLSAVRCQMQPECSAWSKIEDQLKQQSDNLSCVKNNICTGMNCSGSLHGEEFHAGLQIHPCEQPSFIAIFIDIPQLGIHNWQRSFTHGSTFSLADSMKGEINLVKEEDKFIVGLSMTLSGLQKYLPKHTDGTPYQFLLQKFPIFNGTVFPIPSCKLNHVGVTEPSVNTAINFSVAQKENTVRSGLTGYVKIGGNCTIHNSSCSRNETCMQIDKSYSDGVCICRPSYIRSETGQCIYTPESVPTEGGDIIPSPESQAADKSGLSMPTLQTTILVSVTAVLLIIGLAYVGIRFKVFQYLRRKFRVQVYEHVLLGQQEDNDEPLTDPVA